ncbi:MAG: Aminodeoxychorismate lyase [Candidatus Gottesmanbacteria bacterium GW2011_GWB1_43_11]|uniref:Endolytic murein transglycosylase n=1 Tax=Candidatus Gottesmanbacteria bacterium GW2011_GWB1_43_11 TaxID=1618446 RepID=A0A0G1FJ58_9BACT|nr:MAG: Aminodeoxychorismate lyase [Candidatus Gottesmanbacteria bacterium GW2011_GWA2_42_16]KKS55726.1 MAG: Aminodeoxychorismate lyase [Candidatus Gottesmanbacteria bacterium GW2011_GWA1_42_26]KKS80713.1 MAG: Aminodeoxychorismate lyase [Candidatus Gottesmanbacteria bacterium GW2011_GWC1_43_10]KKS86888.1 MAG: Aminodeoxychorismate lyase [Candidatus Gottesmanbacteria bacterium GW2011_GWB1_43_11]OGG10462.1 MAG: hypothetical protein A2699_03745 [Candidatus Gottesmanbacteria bacterium RIFCSPHIGHO2_0
MNKIFIRLAVLGLILLLVIGGGWLWWKDATQAAIPGETTTKIFVVEKGENVRSIATRLKNEKLIKDQIGFFLEVKLLNLDNKLQAGDFRLSPGMTTEQIIEQLTHGTLDTWVTIVEGWRSEEIALKLAQTLAIPETEFNKLAHEGYMFPDTYLIPKDATAAAIVQILEDNFNKRVSAEVRSKITQQGISFADGIILASIVEREGRTDTDRPIIAGVLLKRLKQDWPLQTDATLQYALGYQSETKSWWKKELVQADKDLNSPYNTYKHIGLPPTPIANPGLAAILAIANPVDTPNWYYLHDKEGKAHFAETLEEHNANVNRYLQ